MNTVPKTNAGCKKEFKVLLQEYYPGKASVNVLVSFFGRKNYRGMLVALRAMRDFDVEMYTREPPNVIH